jgi:hypothetical protein
MPLPSDPGYISPAPAHVRNSAIFKALLKTNEDPYAPHSYSRGMITAIEQSVSIPAES